MKTQKELVLEHINKYGGITDVDAVYKYSIMRLGSVIHLLRKDGHKIVTTMKSGKNKYQRPVTYAVYTIKKEEQENEEV